MRLRGNLFIKIFFGFWLATIAVLASWMLTYDYFDSQPTETLEREHRKHGPPHRFMLRVIYQLQHLEQTELVATLQQIQAKHDTVIYLIDDEGNELLSREIPAEVLRTIEQLRAGKRRAFLATASRRYIGHDIYRRDSGPMSAVFEFRAPPPGVLRVLGSSPGLRIGLAVLISGLICFALSRLMTNRLKELQIASRKLASGELETRLQVREAGGDETDELARDFNSMAGQLQERMQAQKRLLSDVSHELRSPLARLQIALALAQKNGEVSGEYLGRIENEAHRLEELVGQLLTSQTQNITVDAHIDLVSLLQQLCADATFEGQQREIRCQFSSELQQAIVGSAGDLLRKCFENILRNALIHTADGSAVNVSVHLVGERFCVHIQDSGPGVPEDELQHIFEEFYRVDTARTRESGGFGLGLAIAHRAVLAHQGEIVAQNNEGGLLITISLPVGS